MKKLAIGITTFNNEDNIDNIKKIYNLEYIDVYIIDDYSTDNTQKLLEENGIEFQLPPEKIGAPGYARNMVLEIAIENGYQFVTFVDGDDDILEDNLLEIVNSLDQKYDMHYTPCLVSGYNDALIPLGSANFEYTGVKTKEELCLEENKKLKFNLLLSSGGRIYNVKQIDAQNLRYDPNKSGQDGLFNHEYFSKISNVKFYDPTKPFYIYDIQMGTLSNNYNLNTLKKRLILIGEMANFDFAINSKEEFAEKTFKRYTETFLVPEEEKSEVANILNDFAGVNLRYSPRNDYLQMKEEKDYKKGLNIILYKCELDITETSNMRVYKLTNLNELDHLLERLEFNKTVVLDNSILEVDVEILASLALSQTAIIQPTYKTENGTDAHGFNKLSYHGYSPNALVSTYTHVGMVYDTRILNAYTYNYNSLYEFLIRALLLSESIPQVINTQGFYKEALNYDRYQRRAVYKIYEKTMYSNTKAKISPYSKMVTTDIPRNNFIGKSPTYSSNNLSLANQSFVESQLLEFIDFEGAYIVDQDNNIVETTSSASSLNFSNMIAAKKISNGKVNLQSKKLINIPRKYSVKGYKIIKFMDFNVLYKRNNYDIISCSYLHFDTDVEIVGDNKEFVQFIDENDNIVEIIDYKVPQGTYKLYLSKVNKKYKNKLQNIVFQRNN